MDDPHDLIWQSAALLGRTRAEASGKPTIQAEIDARIEDLVDLDDEITLGALISAAVALNALSDILDQAISAIKAEISNFLLGELIALLREVETSAGSAHVALGAERASDGAEEVSEASDAAASLGAAAAALPVDDAVAALVVQFDSCSIKPEWQRTIDSIIDRIVANAARYRAVEQAASTPWWFIAILHSLEASGNFGTHLHNGDPLAHRTVHIPIGRPVAGSSPFRWEESAVDALRYDHLADKSDWSLPMILDSFERFNGLGYRNRGLPSPYLWSGSQHYTKGKFTRDRHYDANAVSSQVGAAVLLRRLVNRNIVGISKTRQLVNAIPTPALASVAILSTDQATLPKSVTAELGLKTPVKRGSSGDSVRRVQEWLCHNGFVTAIDGDFGDATARSVVNFRVARQLTPGEAVDEECWLHLTAPLRRAVAPVAVADPSIYAATLAVARQHVEEGPREIGGANSRPWVRVYMDGLQGEAQKWCAGFVCFLIAQAARNLGIAMPIRREVGVDELVADAKNSGRFVAEATLDSAVARQSKLAPGCLFARRSRTDGSDWVHTGLFVGGDGDIFHTIEGNTSGAIGGFDDDAAVERTRSYPHTDFILLV